MKFSKYKELENITNLSDLNEELCLLEKNLFELKIKKAKEKIKPHFFSHLKRRIAQLHFKKSELLKKIA